MRKTILIPLLLLIVLDILFIYLNNHYLVTAEVAETAISGNYNDTHINRWNSINSIFTSFKYLKSVIKIPLCTIVISAFLYVLLKVSSSSASFQESTRLSILGYFVFLLPGFITFLWFGLFKTGYTYTELISFNPFNLKPYFAGDVVSVFEQSIYKSVSLLDVLFVLLLGLLLYRATGKNLGSSLALASVPAIAMVLFSLAYYML